MTDAYSLADEYGLPCICTPAIAGISDGPSVDCPAHGMTTNQEFRTNEGEKKQITNHTNGSE
ncbi:MAG: hypothetical protein CMH34_05260 [Microbacterium sp.]|nr:hypothetical protein [Microbacterium sp.]|tara:strand:+ start:155 stop:340 length:186 start_codon:yes stop_codon:yes gene_type:complete